MDFERPSGLEEMANPIDQAFDPDALLKVIASYRSMDLRNAPLRNVMEKFSFITSFNLIVVNLGKCPVFRARKIEEGEEHNNRSDIWSPPKKYARLCRANDEGESIFYAAFDPVTAIREVKLQPGDRFTLGNFWLSPMEDYYQTSIIVAIPEKTYARTRNQHLHSMILSDFIFSEFTRPVGYGTEFQYKASCAISKLLLDMPHKDSLIYPSMCDFSTYNIAMKNESADKRIRPTQVIKCQMNDWSDNGYPIISIDEEGTCLEGSNDIQYNPFHPDAREFELMPDKFFRGENPNKLVADSLKNYVF